jgi:hypothetical protein
MLDRYSLMPPDLAAACRAGDFPGPDSPLLMAPLPRGPTVTRKPTYTIISHDDFNNDLCTLLEEWDRNGYEVVHVWVKQRGFTRVLLRKKKR